VAECLTWPNSCKIRRCVICELCHSLHVSPLIPSLAPVSLGQGRVRVVDDLAFVCIYAEFAYILLMYSFSRFIRTICICSSGIQSVSFSLASICEPVSSLTAFQRLRACVSQLTRVWQGTHMSFRAFDSVEAVCIRRQGSRMSMTTFKPENIGASAGYD
jgi:hypothetical protein